MKVLWTQNALNDLTNIYEFIARDSEFFALRMIDKITLRSSDISEFPFSGRLVPEFPDENIREIIERPYRIIYKIFENRIDVLAVVHSMRLLK